MPEISHNSASSETSTVTVATPVEIQSASSVAPSAGVDSSSQRSLRGVGPFRFHFDLASFRPGRDFAERRFSIAEAMVLFVAAYLASRGLGVIRQSIFNTLFGAGSQANAYYAAFRLPDTLFNLIAGGALIQAFVPVFVSYEKEQGERETWRLASLVFNVLLVTLTALVLGGELFAPAFVGRWLVPGYSPSEQALTTTLTRIMLLQPLLLGIGSIATAILNSRRQFLLPALSIGVYNVGLIGGLLFSLAIPGLGIYGPTFGVLAAAVCQVLVQVPGLVRQRVGYTFTWNLRHPGLREVIYLLLPNTFSVAIISIGVIVDTAFASYLPDKASLSAIHNAHLLFDVPLALLAQALGHAALPRMSELAATCHYVRLRRLIVKVVGGGVLVSIPVAVVLCVFGRPAIEILFQHGAFTKHASSLTALALIGFALSLPGRIANELLIRGFYALKKPLPPLFTNILGFALRIGLLLLLFRVLTGKYAILAIPLALVGATLIEAGLLCLFLFLSLLTMVTTPRG